MNTTYCIVDPTRAKFAYVGQTGDMDARNARLRLAEGHLLVAQQDANREVALDGENDFAHFAQDEVRTAIGDALNTMNPTASPSRSIADLAIKLGRRFGGDCPVDHQRAAGAGATVARGKMRRPPTHRQTSRG